MNKLTYIGFRNGKESFTRNAGVGHYGAVSAKQNVARNAKDSDKILVQEYRLVPTGKFFYKENGKWFEGDTKARIGEINEQ